MLTRSTLTLALACCSFAQGTWKTDIEFARPGGEPQTLDAWIPDGKGPFPTVIVVHGGGWVNGHKGMFVTPVFEPLKKAGFTWFTINYRLAPKHQFPAATDDTFAAIEWVRAHAKEYKVDPRRIALLGESAGGQIVAYCGATGKGKRRVAAVVDFYGGNDLLALARARQGALKNLAAYLGVA
ncbi:MAG: alpha/beta hydrolase, partial [Acidobacteria bacterium]|nr:alpha/beta hydrolase [Acidobacteriota bacterium]